MINRRPARSRRGSLTPLVMGMALTLALFGAIAIETVRAKVLAERAHAIAQSLALEVLYSTQPSDSGDDAGMPPAVDGERLDAVAVANGYSPHRFHQMRPGDIEYGPMWARVTIRARDFQATPQTVTAYGIHAGRIEAGSMRPGADGISRATGCLPLGIQITALAGEAPETEVQTRGEAAAAHRVVFGDGGGDPLAWLRFLGDRATAGRAGDPPPAVETGWQVERTEADTAFVEELRDQLEGRIAVVPLLHHDTIMGFGRVKVVEVNGETGAVKLALEPSSVLPSASAGPRGNRAHDDSAYPVGRVLAAQVRRHS